MIIRRRHLLVSFLIQWGLVSAQDDPFNCHLTSNGLSFDLTKLTGEYKVSRTRDTPPSTMLDELRFDLCEDLKKLDNVADADQCISGSRACLTKTNKKGSESDRIVAVISIAQSSSLSPEYSALTSPDGLSLILHGSSYPSTSTASPTPQSLNLTLLCNQDTISEPTFTSYNGSVLSVEWSAPAGCGTKSSDVPSGGGDDKEKDGGRKEEHVGSGIGWFFLVLLLALLSYFGLGAYYNYTTYGASGVDLIPHRDFWQEVPYMARDVVSHLCSSVRPRRTSSRGGYIAV